ncbi:MAG: peptide chain release factor N(5)-glutamine methyltransferase [Gammaproteobacteria bacterium]|nr:peptide chain release factor N(5)-glutamine methyltransferase [Gammaproteobacteria bacterium]
MNREDDALIRRLVEDATDTLGSDTGRLDAEVLLASILEKNRSYLHAWPEKILSQETREQFHQLVTKRASGEPVAYLTGQREFWSLPLAVSADTLIPRPETETLVTLALEKIPADSCLHIADLGTGSGAIALAIAHERPRCRIVATDVSPRALAIAASNARNLGIENINFIHGNWCDPLPHEPFDLVLANPPYIEDQDAHLELGDVRFEPRIALAAGPDGMNDLNHIVACARHCLREQGWLMLEHGYNQADRVKQRLSEHGYLEISSHSDEAGLDRVCMGRK